MEEAASSTGSSDYLDELAKPEDQIRTVLEDDNAACVILLKTFEYLSIPDLLNASQVSKIWNYVGSHDVLWRKVILKNCYVNSYDGLFRKLLKHRTQELDIEDAVLSIPDGTLPNEFWRRIFKRIKKIPSLKKVKLGPCPINSVFKIAMAAPQLKSFTSTHLFNGKVNLALLTLMNSLEEFSLTGTNSPMLLTGLESIEKLTSLTTLSMKRILNLFELVNFLPVSLKKLELSWFYKNYSSVNSRNINLSSLSKLVDLENLSLSDEVELGIFLSDTTFLKSLVKLERLKLDRVYSDDLLNHLPTGLKWLIFDWNIFELDLRFLSNLKSLSVLAMRDYRKQLFLTHASSFCSLKCLTSLSLRGVKNLKDVENFLPPSLVTLEIGDCDSLSNDFTTKTLPTLIALKRLQLENGSDIFETNELLNVIASMPNIIHLSLMNMEFKRDFPESLSRCTNLEFLRISPHCTRDLDSLSIHQRIIYSVASLKESLKYFNLGFNSSFLDTPNCINGHVVKVIPWRVPLREDDLSIPFINTSCTCVQPCVYPVHVVMVPIEIVETDILPQLLPKTCGWITKSGLVQIYQDGKQGCARLGDHSEKFAIIKLNFYHDFLQMW